MKIDPRLDAVDDCLYRVTAKAVIFKDGKILFVKDEKNVGWSLPGGGIDVGENMVDAMEREISEEIGLERKNIHVEDKILSVIMGHVKNGKPRCNIHFKVVLTNYNLVASQEIGEFSWFTLEQLKSLELNPATGDRQELIDTVKAAE